ncbi:AAAP amino acid permease [Mycena galericulata]|nr:AAAP amino acid permease [Mycena galericulata]
MPRTIGSLGSFALLVSGLTGPSLAVIPPLMAVALLAFLTGSAALFIIEAMTSMEGNEEFEASIEFTTIAHLYLGKRWHWVVLHWVVQIVLYVAMDSLVISVAHRTCAISFERGWICAAKMLADGNGVFSDYILFSFGTLITFAMIASFVLLLCITVIWLATCIQVGLHHIPVSIVGSNQSNVVGFALSNFAFVTTIPAWINNTHPSVNIRRVVWLSLAIACLIYIPIGWMGAAAFAIDSDATILNVLLSDRPNIVALISTYVFPLAVLITFVPVFAIVVRYNLLRGNICSNYMVIFLSAILPWLIAIPFQTRFSAHANLLIPLFLYPASKCYKASALLDPSISRPSLAVNRSSVAEEVSLHEIATPPFPTLLIPDEPLKPEADDDYLRLVRSPSKQRYYGHPPPNDDILSESPRKDDDESTGFLAPPATSNGGGGGASGPRSTIYCTNYCRTSRRTIIIIEPVSPQPAFEAFPFLDRSLWRSWCTPSRVAAVECGITLLLIVAAFVYSILESVKGNGS